MDGETYAIEQDDSWDHLNYSASIFQIVGVIANISGFIYLRWKGLKVAKEQQKLNENIMKITQIETDTKDLKKLSKLQLINGLGPEQKSIYDQKDKQIIHLKPVLQEPETPLERKSMR